MSSSLKCSKSKKCSTTVMPTFKVSRLVGFFLKQPFKNPNY